MTLYHNFVENYDISRYRFPNLIGFQLTVIGYQLKGYYLTEASFNR